MPTALQWREKARYCRQLALGADASTAESLEMLAVSYDEDACLINVEADARLTGESDVPPL